MTPPMPLLPFMLCYVILLICIRDIKATNPVVSQFLLVRYTPYIVLYAENTTDINADCKKKTGK